MRKALKQIEEEVKANLHCHHPADDGSDECADQEDCLFHTLLALCYTAKQAGRPED